MHWICNALRTGHAGDVVGFLVEGRPGSARGRVRTMSAAAGPGRVAAPRVDVRASSAAAKSFAPLGDGHGRPGPPSRLEGRWRATQTTNIHTKALLIDL